MVHVYDADSGWVFAELDATEPKSSVLMKQLFRTCGQMANKGFFFRGWHGSANPDFLKQLFAYWNQLLDMKITRYSLEFACMQLPGDDFESLLVDLWDAFDSNYIWYFTEPPRDLPTEGPQPQTETLPPYIQLRRFDVDAILMFVEPGLEEMRSQILRSLSLEKRDTAV